MSIYNNSFTNAQLVNALKEWLTIFAVWCQTDLITDKSCNAIPQNKFSYLIDPTKSISCVSQSSNPIQLSPPQIREKFYMGFRGQDCPTFHYNITNIKQFLKYFRGIMVWAIDEDYIKNQQTTTEFIKSIL